MILFTNKAWHMQLTRQCRDDHSSAKKLHIKKHEGRMVMRLALELQHKKKYSYAHNNITHEGEDEN